mgnify:FL=1
MIPGLGPIAPSGIAFLALMSGLVLLAWSPRRDLFMQALALTGAVMAISWLGPRDLLAMLAFQIVPFIVVRRMWGNKQAAAGQTAVVVIALQIVLFLIFKRYAWFDVLGSISLPVSIIGISYILFRQIHLLIEAPYLGHLPFSAGRYMAFTLSPWTLIAGPIQRYDGFCKGLAEIGVGLQGVDESGKFHVAYFFSVDGSSEVIFFPNFFSRASLISLSFVLGRSLMII